MARLPRRRARSGRVSNVRTGSLLPGPGADSGRRGRRLPWIWGI